MTTNDTRTARERAENTGGPEHAAYHQAISAGTLELINLVDDPEMNVDLHGATPSALAQIVARPVWDAAMKFKAEPTTITAEQIEAAERRGAVKALKDAAMSVNLLVSTGMGLTPSELNLIDACASGAAQGWLMAQAARIEGDPNE